MIRRRAPRFYAGQWGDVLRTVLTGKVVEGPHLTRFEERFARFLGVSYAVSTCSGRVGLGLILEALDLRPGDEVLIPAYTLKGLVPVIRSRGLGVRCVDIDERSFNIAPDLIEKNITPKTKAILATHLFGCPCDIKEIVEIARKHGLRVIEDCAHALGAEYDGRKVGSFGDAAFFSLEVIKHVNTFGGGMVVTNDPGLFRRISEKNAQYPVRSGRLILKILFVGLEQLLIVSPVYPWLIQLFRSGFWTGLLGRLYRSLHDSTNVSSERYTDLQARMGLRQLDELDERNRRRGASALALIKQVGPGAAFQPHDGCFKHAWYFLVTRVPSGTDAHRVRNQLLSRGVDAGIGDEITDDCASVTGDRASCPVAARVYVSAVQLPLFDEMSPAETGRIARAVDEWGRLQENR
ncbi:MAG TPA: aminotransferase class I/II-fold pyridoxal phosphate-dependent enzyme [Elusimicrobiota bacterium]|nr:aminotransferase class I/II-fold pyridoxal phosphate-dependent enzyme [Elusimicrobiota bacterium]